jgi:hypothetical protein
MIKVFRLLSVHLHLEHDCTGMQACITLYARTVRK